MNVGRCSGAVTDSGRGLGGSIAVVTVLGLNGSCNAASPAVAAIVEQFARRPRWGEVVGAVAWFDVRLSAPVRVSSCTRAYCRPSYASWYVGGPGENAMVVSLNFSLLHFTWNRRTPPRLASRQPKPTTQRYYHAKLGIRGLIAHRTPRHRLLEREPSFLCSQLNVTTRLRARAGQAPSYTWRGHFPISPRTSRCKEAAPARVPAWTVRHP